MKVWHPEDSRSSLDVKKWKLIDTHYIVNDGILKGMLTFSLWIDVVFHLGVNPLIAI